MGIDCFGKWKGTKECNSCRVKISCYKKGHNKYMKNPYTKQCKKCGSGYTYLTLSKIVCRKCGHRSARKK